MAVASALLTCVLTTVVAIDVFDGCGKSAARPANLCIALGGGKRCLHLAGCGKSAVSSTYRLRVHI